MAGVHQISPVNQAMNSGPISHEDFVLAIADLSNDNLQSLKTQLAKSISQLVATNTELETETHSTSATADDTVLYRECIVENNKVIYDQTRRALALLDSLHERGALSESAKQVEAKAIIALANPVPDSSVYL